MIADNARDMFTTFTVIFTIIAITSTLCFIFGREDDGCLTCPNDGLAERSKKSNISNIKLMSKINYKFSEEEFQMYNTLLISSLIKVF